MFFQTIDRETSFGMITFSGLLTDADLVAPLRYWAKCGPPRVARLPYDFRDCDSSGVTPSGLRATARLASDCAFFDALTRTALVVSNSRMLAHAEAYKLLRPVFLGEFQVYMKIAEAFDYLGVFVADPELYLPIGDFGGEERLRQWAESGEVGGLDRAPPIAAPVPSENLVNTEMIDVFGTVGQPAVDDAPCPRGPARRAPHASLAASRTRG